MLKTIFLVGIAVVAFAATTNQRPQVPMGTPAAVVDLATEGGVRLVNGQWHYHDTRIIQVDFRGPGADRQPTGAPLKTYGYEPHAGGSDFDDSA